MNARLRMGVWLAILTGTLAFVVVDHRSGNAPALAVGTAGPGSEVAETKGAAPSTAPTDSPLALPERAALGESSADLFSSFSWQPPPPPQPTVAPKPPPPVAPPLPYRFAGQLIQGDRPEVFLAKGDSVIPVGKGDTLDGLYR